MQNVRQPSWVTGRFVGDVPCVGLQPTLTPTVDCRFPGRKNSKYASIKCGLEAADKDLRKKRTKALDGEQLEPHGAFTTTVPRLLPDLDERRQM